MDRIVAASGTAEIRVPPDRARIHVAIRATSAVSADDAAERSAALERRVSQALSDADVATDRTSSVRYDAGRERQYGSEGQVAGDYYAEHVLSVVVDDLPR